jgi:flagellar basal body-associated protein FliL
VKSGKTCPTILRSVLLPSSLSKSKQSNQKDTNNSRNEQARYVFASYGTFRRNVLKMEAIKVKISLCLTNSALRHEGVWDWMYRSIFS